jgi:hypothetical protein
VIQDNDSCHFYACFLKITLSQHTLYSFSLINRKTQSTKFACASHYPSTIIMNLKNIHGCVCRRRADSVGRDNIGEIKTENQYSCLSSVK